MIKGIFGVLLFLGIYGALFSGNDSSTKAESTPVEPKFKCLSAWDGSYPDLKRHTKKNMKDPKSFDHRETRITPIVNGYQNVFMEYAGRNSFGGIVIEFVGARIRNSDCKLISII